MIPAACGKQPPVIPPPAPTPSAPPDKPPPPPPPPPERPREVVPPPENRPVIKTPEDIFRESDVPALNRLGLLEDVFFDFDAAELSDRARASLTKNADWLKQPWNTAMVSVEGHADARGTSEYNLALGDRRAASVRDYLISLGIPAARLTIVSLGEERPTCTEETEVCWAQNRRGHGVITGK